MTAKTRTTVTHVEYCGSRCKELKNFASVNYRFGSRVRDLRIAANVLPVDLSFQIEVTRSHLEDIEDGIETVDLEQVHRLASALRMSVADILVGI